VATSNHLVLAPEEIAFIINEIDGTKLVKYPALNVRFVERMKPVALAIILAESGGDCDAHRDKPPKDNSYGLAQINMIGGMGPQRRAAFGLAKNEDLFDPYINTRVMAVLAISGDNFKPWSTYTDGTYLKYIPTATVAMGKPKDPGSKVNKHATDEVGEQGAGDKLMNWVGHGLFRAALFVGGGAVLIGAIALAAKKGIKS
jgi:hypothetical protein